MNFEQIIDSLPPRAYLRSGELVIHFSTPGDLVARVTETQAALSAIERPEPLRGDVRTRGRIGGRSSSISHEERTSETEVVDCTGSAARTQEGKEG
jgi:hypothetical protein